MQKIGHEFLTHAPKKEVQDRDPLDRDPPSGQRPLFWTETPLLDRDPPRQRPPWTETPSPQSCDLWCMLGQRCPCEQNHRCLWKHNLAATKLWVVITIRNKVVKVMFLQVSVCPQGGAWSWGWCVFWGMPDPGGAWSGGVPGLGGCLVLGWCWYPSMH